MQILNGPMVNVLFVGLLLSIITIVVGFPPCGAVFNVFIINVGLYRMAVPNVLSGCFAIA